MGILAVSDPSPILPPNALGSLVRFNSATEASPGVQKFASDRVTCHLSAPVAPSSTLYAPRFYRSTGCSACHHVCADDGLYRGLDATVQRDQPGHGVTHRLTTQIPYSQCNHCSFSSQAILRRLGIRGANKT